MVRNIKSRILRFFGFDEPKAPQKKSIKPVFTHIIAHDLCGEDAEFMYNDKNDIPGVCPFCHSKLRMIPNLSYKKRRRKKKWDIYNTYDGYCLVSEKFKNFCEENGYPNLSFIKLERSKPYYFFLPGNIFPLDITRDFVELDSFCPVCHTYNSVAGCAFKRRDFQLSTDDFICRSDVFFGYKESQSPCIIIGLKTKEKMEKAGLKGLSFRKVYN